MKEEENSLVIEWDEIDPPIDNMNNFRKVMYILLNGKIFDIRNISSYTVREFLVVEGSEGERWNNIFRRFDEYNLRSFITDVFQIQTAYLLTEMYSVNLLLIEDSGNKEMFENIDSDIPDEEIDTDREPILF